MPENRPGIPLAAILYFTAAALSWGAAAIRYSLGKELRWELIGAGLFCAVIGFTMMMRALRPGTGTNEKP